MPVRAVDDKPSDTLVVVSGEGFWTGSSTLPHLHQHALERVVGLVRVGVVAGLVAPPSRTRFGRTGWSILRSGRWA